MDDGRDPCVSLCSPLLSTSRCSSPPHGNFEKKQPEIACTWQQVVVESRRCAQIEGRCGRTNGESVLTGGGGVGVCD